MVSLLRFCDDFLGDRAACTHHGLRCPRGRFRQRSTGELMIRRDISWEAMLGKDERDATKEEIAALGAEHGPFLPADGEG